MSSSELSQPPVSVRSRLQSKAAKWRESPERLAWIIMLVSFAIFCALAITTPMGFRYALRYASVQQDAQLSAITRTTGKVLLYPNANAEPILIRDERSAVREGMRILSLDGAAQGSLEFVNEASQNVLGGLQIYSDTDLAIERIRRPLFNSSTEPYYVRLRMLTGQVRILSNSSDDRPLRIDLLTPQGQVRMQNGSYLLAVDAAKTEVQVRSGLAELHLENGISSVVDQDQTAQLIDGQIIHAAATSGQNWLVNGTFQAPVDDAWLAAPAENVVFPGDVTYVDGGGRQVAYFSQLNAEGHSDIGISQVISRDVQAIDSLQLQMDVKILFQSLPEAGERSSEFPIRVEINFTSVYGQNIPWGHGFYYREAEEGTLYPKPPPGESTLLKQGEWYSFQSENLIEWAKARGTPVSKIDSIRVYASGHNYQSLASEVYLLAQ